MPETRYIWRNGEKCQNISRKPIGMQEIFKQTHDQPIGVLFFTRYIWCKSLGSKGLIRTFLHLLQQERAYQELSNAVSLVLKELFFMKLWQKNWSFGRPKQTAVVQIYRSRPNSPLKLCLGGYFDTTIESTEVQLIPYFWQ